MEGPNGFRYVSVDVGSDIPAAMRKIRAAVIANESKTVVTSRYGAWSIAMSRGVFGPNTWLLTMKVTRSITEEDWRILGLLVRAAVPETVPMPKMPASIMEDATATHRWTWTE